MSASKLRHLIEDGTPEQKHSIQGHVRAKLLSRAARLVKLEGALPNFLRKIATRRHLVLLAGSLLVFFVMLSTVQRVLGWRIQHEIQLMAETLQLSVELDTPLVHLLGLTPEVSVSDLSVSYADQPAYALLESTDVSVELGWLQLLRDFRVIPTIRVQRARLNLLVDDEGQNNWDEALSIYQQLKQPDDADDADDAEYTIDLIDIRKVEIEYINDSLQHLGSFWLSGSIMPGIFSGKTALTASGDVNYLPATLTLNLFESPKATNQAALDLVVRFDDIDMHASASIDKTDGLPDVHGELLIAAENLVSLFKKLGFDAIGFKQAEIAASWTYQQAVLAMDFEKFTAGRSRLSANLVVQHDEAHGQLEAVNVDLVSEELNLDEILSLVIDTSEPEHSATESEGISPSGRVFSAQPFELPSWLAATELDANLQIHSLYKGALYLPSLTLQATKTDAESRLTVVTAHSGEGELTADMLIDHTETPLKGRLTLRSTRVPLIDIFSLASVSESMASGQLSGSAKFWYDASSMADIASSLDGGMFVIVEDGKLDSLLVEMAGIDLLESISLVINKDLQQTDIRCGFLDLHVQKGLLVLDDFVVDTDDSVFLASGSVDLAKERLDLQFAPHPHDASFFAATTSINVNGTLSVPRIRPGGKLYSRLALATAMAALTGPAAFVLPFIEVGHGDNQSYCSELFTQ